MPIPLRRSTSSSPSLAPPSSVDLTTVAGGMLCVGTPVEDYRESYGLWVKREDLACPPPGPPFSKTRGVYARVASRDEEVIGVLDTRHSQAGWAVARACQILGKRCVNFYPVYRSDRELREPQAKARSLGAELVGLPAGRSAILFHSVRKQTEQRGGYVMPNALKLDESVDETAKEVPTTLRPDYVLVPISSGTIAAGVIKGFAARHHSPIYIIHLGYSRSHEQVLKYLADASGIHKGLRIRIIDEGYEYADSARKGPTPPWPCNEWYDLKAFRWWMRERNRYKGETLLWNIG